MGFFNVLYQIYDQSRPPKPKFHVEDMPDLSDKVTIVTGGNTGVGKETIKVRRSAIQLAIRYVDTGPFRRC